AGFTIPLAAGVPDSNQVAKRAGVTLQEDCGSVGIDCALAIVPAHSMATTISPTQADAAIKRIPTAFGEGIVQFRCAWHMASCPQGKAISGAEQIAAPYADA